MNQLTGQGEHERQGKLIETQMQSKHVSPQRWKVMKSLKSKFKKY